MNDFLNPKSMLTPGAAGALVMFLSNAVCQAFPEIAFRYVALGLSLLVGGIVFTATTMEIVSRICYWVLNSLIIFAMGVGSSNIGANLTQDQGAAHNSAYLDSPSSLGGLIISSSWAQPVEPEGAQPSARVLTDREPSPQELEQLRKEQERLRNEIQRLESERALIESGTKPAEQQEPEIRKFFQRW